MAVTPIHCSTVVPHRRYDASKGDWKRYAHFDDHKHYSESTLCAVCGAACGHGSEETPSALHLSTAYTWQPQGVARCSAAPSKTNKRAKPSLCRACVIVRWVLASDAV